MKRFLLVPLLLIACARAPSGGQLASVNIIDQNGMSQTVQSKDRLARYQNVDFEKGGPYQKALRVYGRDGEGHVRSKITGYHPNGQPCQALDIVDGRAFGSYREWHSNGQLKLTSLVVGGSADIDERSVASFLFDGWTRAWDEEGHLLAQIPYWKGELHGLSTYFYSDGKIWKEIPFRGGNRMGTSREYDQRGELIASCDWEENLPCGSAVNYFSKDRIASIEEYDKGLLSLGEYYSPEGRLIASVKGGNGIRAIRREGGIIERQEICSGKQEGRVELLNSHGSLARSYHVVAGLKHGEEVEYYPDPFREGPKPKMALNWSEGAITGIVKTWYSSGVLESKREIGRNQKNGVSMGWYQDGNLMLIEEYIEGRLIKGEYFPKGTPSAISRVLNGRGMATLYDAEGNYLRKISYFEGLPVDS